MKVFKHPTNLLEQQGADLGSSSWLLIDQERIDLFAQATGDHQWIHTDKEKAAQGPYGATIAHGYLTLALVNYFLPQLMKVEGIEMGVNVGLNRVRFPEPVRSGRRVSATGTLLSACHKHPGIEAVVRVTIHVEGATKPACVAEVVSRYFALSEPAGQ